MRINSYIAAFQQCPLLIKLSVILHGLIVPALLIAPHHWPMVLALILANHLVIAMIGLWPRSQWLGPNWTTLPHASVLRREVALTIDDGPDPIVTPQVLAILDQFNTKATFFCIGNKMVAHTDLCREIVRRGHLIENHSQRHRHNFSLLGLKGFSQEITHAQQTILHITGRQPQFFRAPAGLRNPFLTPVLRRLNLQLVSWTARGFDTRVNNADRVCAKLLNNLEPGAILLLHDGNAARTAANIPVIVTVLPALLAQAIRLDLRFVTLADAAQ